jgi:hypothetical protein
MTFLFRVTFPTVGMLDGWRAMWWCCIWRLLFCGVSHLAIKFNIPARLVTVHSYLALYKVYHR